MWVAGRMNDEKGHTIACGTWQGKRMQPYSTVVTRSLVCAAVSAALSAPSAASPS